MSNLEREQIVQQMIVDGKIPEAFEKYYADHMVMVEGTAKVCFGKLENRNREEQFFTKVKKVNGAGVRLSPQMKK